MLINKELLDTLTAQAKGNLLESFLVSADGDVRGISVPKGQWHNAESLESGTVILECKDGTWKPLDEENILK